LLFLSGKKHAVGNDPPETRQKRDRPEIFVQGGEGRRFRRRGPARRLRAAPIRIFPTQIDFRQTGGKVRRGAGERARRDRRNKRQGGFFRLRWNFVCGAFFPVFCG